MKLRELKIRNVRGVTRLDLAPDGKTIAVIGSNGTGKSAVVDAIDFLLTGEIGRLSGRRGLSLQRHGKHVKAKRPEECFVEAVVDVPGIADSVTLRRSFKSPGALDVPAHARQSLAPFLAAAAQRQYVLTRKNILDFISAQPRDRAALVQAVLHLERVEELRQTLTKCANAEKDSLKAERGNRISTEGAACETLELATWNDQSALDAVNRLRAVLEGAPVESLADAKKDLVPPGDHTREAATQRPMARTDPVSDIVRVGKSVAEDIEAKLEFWDEQLRREIAVLNANPERARAARLIELVELGIQLLDDTTLCPLCDTSWEADRLRDHLVHKAERGRTAAPSWRVIRETGDAMLHWIGDNEEAIERIIAGGRQDEAGSDPSTLAGYAKRLVALSEALADPLNKYTDYRDQTQTLSEQLGIANARELLRSLYRERAAAARKDPAQAAWDTLTGFEKNLKALIIAREREASALNSANRLESLRVSFLDARDKVLGELYESVKDRFVELYRELHPDEVNFDANLAPDGAGLTLEVAFYDVSEVPPIALHSEGHQDSMGLCLFLALAERMQGARLGFCLLDDIVMAIDAGHRMKVAKLLTSLKAQTQFVIATHDLTWAKQLQAEGCVSSRTCTRFIGWTIDGGPVVAELTDFLGEAEAALSSGNVHTAAHALRYGLESFVHVVADSIGAEARYSLSGQYEMGNLYDACNRKLKKLITDAKNAAQSWDQADVVSAMDALGRRRSQILENAQIERWAMNPNVHFNQWMNMDANEFQPVLRAFRDVCGLFKCAECGSVLTLVVDGVTPKTVKCACGKSNWNLEKNAA